MVRTYPATANADTSAQAAVLDAPDSTYSLLYFDSQGICRAIRDMLALSGAQWKQLFPQDWENEDRADKESTPFEVMPVLYVHSKDGKEVYTSINPVNTSIYRIQHSGRKKTVCLPFCHPSSSCV